MTGRPYALSLESCLSRSLADPAHWISIWHIQFSRSGPTSNSGAHLESTLLSPIALAGGNCNTVNERFRAQLPALPVDVADTTRVDEPAGVPELGSAPPFPAQVASEAAISTTIEHFQTARRRWQRIRVVARKIGSNHARAGRAVPRSREDCAPFNGSADSWRSELGTEGARDDAVLFPVVTTLI